MNNIHSVDYGTTTIQYYLSYSPRKTLAIDVHPDLTVSVIAPEGSELNEVAAVVKKRGSWILRQMREFETYLPHLPPRKYISGETHRYLGKQYRLKVIEDATEAVKLMRGRIFVHVPDPSDTNKIKQLLDDWYRSHAKRIFSERLEACFPRVAKYGLGFPEYEIRTMEKRWGSCTPQGKLLLNLKLTQVPKHLIDYVVMHELCHLKEHNHGADFYSLLTKAMPDWEFRRQQLNQMDVA